MQEDRSRVIVCLRSSGLLNQIMRKNVWGEQYSNVYLFGRFPKVLFKLLFVPLKVAVEPILWYSRSYKNT